GSLLGESPLPRREVILISDFQRRGWEQTPGRDDVRLPDKTVVTPVAVGDPSSANLSVTPVSLQRTRFENQDRVAVTAGVANRSASAARVTLSLDLNGQQMQALPVSIGPNGTASVTFAPFTVSSRNMRATVRLPPDALARDNVFHFVVSPGEPVRTVVVNRAGAERESLYLLRALSIGDTPRVEITERTSDTLSDNDLRVATVVILNDVPVSDTLADRLARFVIAGGGLLFSSGPHASWPAARADVLPGL